MTIKRLFLNVANIHLCCVDYGGDGTPILLLHGLAGRASEWRSTASWLTQHGHVFALDQRGHGMSDKPDTTYSRDEYVNDCIAVIEQLHLAPVILIGQSIGGQHAFLVAARRPDLVRALICVEATPDASPSARQMVSKWLDSWPLPFPTLADARTFFGGDTLYAQTWIEVLEERPDGYWPQFHKEHMLRSAAEQGIRDYWHEWDQVRCPTLLVGGANSFVPQQQIQAMAQRLPHAHYTRIANAGHDLHLEQPQAWRETVESFLSSLAPRKTT